MQKSGGRGGKGTTMSDAEIIKLRESAEQAIQEMTARMSEWKEGRQPERPPQSKEAVCSVGFSRNGQWLWCGTDWGIQVYDWARVPRDCGAEWIDPIWICELSNASEDPNWRNRGWAVAEEVDSPAIVFGGIAGQLYRLDLESGQTRELVKLPGEAWIYALAMSADGSALGINMGTLQFSEAARKRGERTPAWEVWSYPRLRDL